jgi:hypothetical protein
MRATLISSFLLLTVIMFLSALGLQASEGDSYSSFWKCSDGNTYGLVAEGNKRALYIPAGASPVFFSGVKKGESYVGTIYLGGDSIPVSGPITNNDKRVTLQAADGRVWVLNFSHK